MNHTRKILHFYTLIGYLTIKKVTIIILHVKKVYLDVYENYVLNSAREAENLQGNFQPADTCRRVIDAELLRVNLLQ